MNKLLLSLLLFTSSCLIPLSSFCVGDWYFNIAYQATKTALVTTTALLLNQSARLVMPNAVPVMDRCLKIATQAQVNEFAKIAINK